MGHSKLFFELIKGKCYYPGLRNLIKHNLRNCAVCLKYNIPKVIKEKQSCLLGSNAGRVLQMDLLGPLPNSYGFKYIWAGIDSYDRSCYLRGLKTTNSTEMSILLSKFFSENGVWEFIAIDNKCLSFKGLDKQLLDKLKIGIVRSNRCSRHQGMVERLLQSVLIKMLKLLDGDEHLDGWFTVLPRLEFLLNSAPHSSLGWRSPNDVRFRRPPALVVPVLTNPGDGERGGNFQGVAKMAELIRKSAFRNLLKNRHFYEIGEALVEGMVVWRKRQAFSTNMNKKLQYKITQAFIIQKRVGSGLYKVADVENGEISILPIDQMIRTKLSLEEVRDMLTKLRS